MEKELFKELKYFMRIIDQIPWIVEGPGNITDPMFLGTGSNHEDKKVHERYLKTKKLIEELDKVFNI